MTIQAVEDLSVGTDRVVQDHEAILNITYNGENTELPDPVSFDANAEDIRRWATEAVRSGSVPGIPADPRADFTDYIVDKFRPNAQRTFNVIFLRPKTSFG